MQHEPDQTVTSHFGPQYREARIGRIATVAVDAPLRLDCGVEVSGIPIAYQCWGTLNAERSNAILICHGLTGDQYLLGTHPVTGKPGWGENIAGPGKPIDTDQYFVICTNVIGSCMGSWGPKEINPETGEPYGLSFPVLTIADMVRAQTLLIAHLGIERLFCVVGGSMGGMMALEWAAHHPERAFSVLALATTARHSAQNIAFHEIGRQAIMADPEWCGGNYWKEKRFPSKGLAVARMTAHVTYLSETTLHHKFGRNLQDREQPTYGFDADFQVESYLRHQGVTFVERFDPNSYLYITRAMDYFDLAEPHGGRLADAFRHVTARCCVISFSTDWLFPTEESRRITHALNAVGANVSFTEIKSSKGHDAFLLREPEFERTVKGFLQGVQLAWEKA